MRISGGPSRRSPSRALRPMLIISGQNAVSDRKSRASTEHAAPSSHHGRRRRTRVGVPAKLDKLLTLAIAMPQEPPPPASARARPPTPPKSRPIAADVYPHRARPEPPSPRRQPTKVGSRKAALLDVADATQVAGENCRLLPPSGTSPHAAPRSAREASSTPEWLAQIFPPVEVAPKTLPPKAMPKQAASLRSQLPVDWQTAPKMARVRDAADRFDDRHVEVVGAAQRLMDCIEREPVNHDTQRRMEISLLKLASNRFSVQPLRLEAIISPRYAAKLPYQVAGDSDLGGPWQPLMKMMPDAVVPGKVVRREWKIEESIWKPRRKWADSRDFYDTDESMMRALENDLKMACSGDGLVRLVARHHTSPTAKGGGGVPSAADLMEQVKQALWTHHHMIYCIFDVYAALGVGDFTHMTANAYKQLLDDCNLIETAVDGLNAGLWDQLFVGINAVNTISEGDQYNHKKGLNRQEFVSFVVRAAVMRHVAFGEFTDVPAAIEQLLGTDMIPKIRQAVPSLAPANEFRAALCYQEETSDVFSRHIVSLRTIFDRYAYGAGQVNDKTNDRRLLGFDEWQELVDHLGLVDSQFAERQAGLCFILSRMRTTLESTTQGRAKVLQLSFEDFLEALVS